MARELAGTGAKILIVERGDFIPQEDHNWNPAAVWRDLRYRTTETWLDERGQSFRPYTHYCVGGNTKFWGTVMYRLRPEDFGAVEHVDGISPAWPIDYDTLAPFYDRAERLYEVHGEQGLDPTEGPRGPFPFPPVPHSRGRRRDRRSTAGTGAAPFAAATRTPRELHLLQYLQFVPLQDPRKERRRRMRGTAGHAEPECVAVDQCASRAGLLTDATGKKVEAVEVERGGTIEKVSAPARHRVVWRR